MKSRHQRMIFIGVVAAGMAGCVLLPPFDPTNATTSSRSSEAAFM